MTDVSHPAGVCHVLYAEDDDNDVFLMRRAFEKLGIANPLSSVSDGRLAMDYLAGEPPYDNAREHPTPGLLLLDLSMPGKKGLDVLKWARTQPRLSGLPIVVLTSSNQETDIHRAYLLGANGFFIKPGDPDELLQIVGAIQQFWLSKNPARTNFVDIGAYRSAAEGTSPS